MSGFLAAFPARGPRPDPAFPTTLLAVLVMTGIAPATVIRVDWAGGGDYLTIQEGIDAAAEGDTILIAPGTYTGALNTNLDFGGINRTVMTEAGCVFTHIDCENVYPTRGFHFHSGEDTTSIVEGVTIMNGRADRGGAISCYGYFGTDITRSIMAFSTDGGGIHCQGTPNPDMWHCCIYANTGGDSLCGTYHDNIFEHPLFCDSMTDDYTLHIDSPCLPPNNPFGEQIGALGLRCGTGTSVGKESGVYFVRAGTGDEAARARLVLVR